MPVVLALNMMDEVQGNGGSIRLNEMEEQLGIPVVSISAVKNEGIGELVDHAVHLAKYQERPGRVDFCDKDDKGGARTDPSLPDRDGNTRSMAAIIPGAVRSVVEVGFHPDSTAGMYRNQQ